MFRVWGCYDFEDQLVGVDRNRISVDLQNIFIKTLQLYGFHFKFFKNAYRQAHSSLSASLSQSISFKVRVTDRIFKFQVKVKQKCLL